MGKASHFFPSVGLGTRAKLVVNSLMGTMLAAYGESLALSESVGLDPTTMIQVMGQGAISESNVWSQGTQDDCQGPRTKLSSETCS